MNFDFHRLITPSAWIQSSPTNWEWDRQLNKFLDTNPSIIKVTEYTVEFRDIELWVSNYPYCYGFPVLKNSSWLPSFGTRRRLKKYIQNWVLTLEADFE